MVKDFSTQFSPLYLLMKYLAIISRYPVYILNFILIEPFHHQFMFDQFCLRPNVIILLLIIEIIDETFNFLVFEIINNI